MSETTRKRGSRGPAPYPPGQGRTIHVGFRLRPEVAARLGATPRERNARARAIVEAELGRAGPKP